MTNSYEKLLNLGNDKLIDVVKNYRQYGYELQLREAAINILADRGVTKEQLQLSGNLENKTYNYANDLYSSFLRSSKIAFILYLVFFISQIATSVLNDGLFLIEIIFLIFTVLSLIIYLVFLIKSFINQSKIYKIFGNEYGTEGALIYLFLGMPFYLIMYFYFRSDMKNKMKEIK